jgi:hypothetical protein
MRDLLGIWEKGLDRSCCVVTTELAASPIMMVVVVAPWTRTHEADGNMTAAVWQGMGMTLDVTGGNREPPYS